MNKYDNMADALIYSYEDKQTKTMTQMFQYQEPKS